MRLSTGWRMFLVYGILSTLVLKTVWTYQSADTDASLETVKEAIEDITQMCFGSKIHGPWNVYHDQALDCTSIRKVLSIIPSCTLCKMPSPLAFTWRDCYKMQSLACAQSQYCPEYCKCEKYKGNLQVVAKPGLEHYWTTTASMETSSSQQQSEGDVGAKRDRQCEKGVESGMPVGVAIALFVLGLLIGAFLTAVICICAPCCDRRSADIRNKMATTFSHLSPRTSEAKSSTVANEDGTAVSRASVASPMYQALSTDQNDSHPYSRSHDQGAIYTEPMADNINTEESPNRAVRGSDTCKSSSNGPMRTSGIYEPSANGPIKSVHSVQSPVYNQFSYDDILPGKKPGIQQAAGSTYQPLDHTLDRDSRHKYGVLSSTGTSDQHSHQQPTRSNVTYEPTNHNYFTLEPSSNTADSETCAGHQYFELEADNNPVPGTSDIGDHDVDSPNTQDQKQHEYFVLEKDT